MILPAILLGAATLISAQDPEFTQAQEKFGREVVELHLAGQEAALIGKVSGAPLRASLLVHGLLREALLAGGLEAPPAEAASALAEALAEAGWQGPLEEEHTLRAASDEERARWLECETLQAQAAEAAAQRDGEQALQLAEEAWTRSRDQPSILQRAQCAARLGEFLVRGGRHQAAEEALRASLELAGEARSGYWKARAALGLGRLEFRGGRYAAALGHYRVAEEIGDRAGDGEILSFSYAEYAVLMAHLGRWEESRAACERALGDARKSGDEQAEVYAREATASLAVAAGDYAAALRIYEEVLSQWRRLRRPMGEAGSLILLGGLLGELGRYADSEAALRDALALLPEGREPVREGYAWLGLGILNLDRQNLASAVGNLRSAVRAFREARHEAGQAEALHHLAAVALRQGDHAAAEAGFARAAQLRADLGQLFGHGLSLCGAGDASLARGDLAAARQRFADAAAAMAGAAAPELAWRASFGLGRCAEAAGDESEALDFYRAAVAELEDLRARLASPALRLRYLGDKLSLYRRASRLAARAGAAQESFRLAEGGKARTLFELQAMRPEEAQGFGLEPQRVAAMRLAEARLRAAEMQLAQGAPSDGAGVQARRREEREEARVQHSRARLAVESSAPRRAAWLGLQETPSLAEVQQALPDGALLLAFQVDESGSSVWVLSREAAQFVELSVGEAWIEERVAKILAPFRALASGSVDLANLRFEAGAAHELYRALIEPLAGELGGAELILVVRDGPLRPLPFALLVAERHKRPVQPGLLFAQYQGCRFLVEDFALAYLPAASLLVAPRPTSAPPSAALVMADPLPTLGGAPRLAGARAEAEAWAREDPEAHVWVGEDASEARFKERAGEARFLHLAVHGSLDDLRPAYSRLALAPGDGEDGWLHAYELEKLRLQAPVAVLSACESLGSAGRGEGLLGLTRAFLQAGAGTVVASTWRVEDAATARLMARFREALGEGAGVAEALQGAQLEVMRGAPSDGVAPVHPFFWAGFQAVG